MNELPPAETQRFPHPDTMTHYRKLTLRIQNFRWVIRWDTACYLRVMILFLVFAAVAVLLAGSAVIIVNRRNRSGATPADQAGHLARGAKLGLEPQSRRDDGAGGAF